MTEKEIKHIASCIVELMDQMGTIRKSDPDYTIQELADKMRTSRTTVEELISTGNLKSYWIGNRKRVSAEAYRNYVACHGDRPTTKKPHKTTSRGKGSTETFPESFFSNPKAIRAYLNQEDAKCL